VTSLFRKLHWLLRRRSKEAELEEELQSHLDEETEEQEAAGLSPEKAYRAARLELGNVALVKEDTRAAWSWMVWEQLVRDVRDAVRLLTRDIPVNVVILSIIALGITANTVMFSVVNSMLLKFPVADPERLFVIHETHNPDFPRSDVSSGNFLEWQQASKSFQSMAAIVDQRLTLFEDGTPESISGARITASYFATMGIKPQLGRGIFPEKDQAAGSDVVIISGRLWARRFGSDPGIIGRTIHIDSRQLSIIGVMDIGMDETDAWVPMAFDAADRDNRSSHNLTVFGRLTPDASSEDASAELKRIARHLETVYPGTNRGWSVVLTPVAEGKKAVAYLVLLLWGVAGFVLLIACANIANLLLARSISRRREVAIRMAIGATRFQVIRQLLAESIVLALIGGAAGLLVTYWGARALNTLGSDVLPITVRMEPILLVFTASLSVITGVIFGLMPALELSNSSLSESINNGTRCASASQGHRRMRSALVTAEVSVSLVLLIGAGLLMRSFVKLTSVNPGFNATNVLVAELTLPARKYASADQARRFTESALEEISSLPGVSAVSASQALPFSSDFTYGVVFEGRPDVKDSEAPPVNYFAVSPQYFGVLEIPLKRGRVFTKEDGAASPLVVIVNETFASRFFPNESAVGKRIRVTSERRTWREIVGVVGDTKQQSLDAAPTAQIYEPLEQMPFSSMTFIVKTSGHPMSLARSIEKRIQTVDAEQPMAIRTLRQVVNESVFSVQIVLIFLSAFAGVALLIAATGLYGVIAYSVSQRTHEIGLRMALGADRKRLLAMVLRQGMFPVAIGLMLGLGMALALTRLLRALLFQTSATDGLTFVGISALLISVSLLACYIPARRATKIDPMMALRTD
jgi:predicted permease